MILNLFIKVDKEMEINGIKYSFVSDLGRPNHIGAWVALPRKEIEKHIPKGSAVSEFLVDNNFCIRFCSFLGKFVIFSLKSLAII